MSYETIRAGFPPMPFIATNDNPPNLNFLLLCTEHLGECAQSHPHRLHIFGHRYLALTSIMYAVETLEAYPVRQTNPGASLTYNPTTTTLQRANTDNLFGVEYRNFHVKMPMDHALGDRLYEL